jgi:hypothetical protein
MFVTPDGSSHYEAGKRPIRLCRYCTFLLFQRNLSSCLVFFTVSDSICACVLVRATCPIHLIVLDLIALMLFDKDYKSGSSSLCNFLQSPVYSSAVGPLQEPPIQYCSLLATCQQFRSRHGPTGVEWKHNTVSHRWHRAALLNRGHTILTSRELT